CSGSGPRRPGGKIEPRPAHGCGNAGGHPDRRHQHAAAGHCRAEQRFDRGAAARAGRSRRSAGERTAGGARQHRHGSRQLRDPGDRCSGVGDEGERMSLDWILSPLTQYALAALVLVICGYSFVATKRELYHLRRENEESRTALAKKIAEVESAMASRAEEAPPVPAVPSLRPGLNLTRRAQALRMQRRGESIESITAALAVPRNEVELLLKVHQMLECRSN